MSTSGSPTSPGYLLDNRAPEAEDRLRQPRRRLFNPGTFRHMEALGISTGWSCWEVGVGGPSIPRWLSQRVVPSGRVRATDIDVRWAQESIEGNVEVRRHDVVADEPPSESFDLVHERLVLIHLPEREEALDRMISTLRPGGWVLVEDFDSVLQPFACPDEHGAAEQLANKVRAGFRALLKERAPTSRSAAGSRVCSGTAGLVDVGADAYLGIATPAARGLEIANVQQIRDGLIAGGHVTREEVDAHLAAVGAGALDVATSPLVSAWGRKP